MPIKLKKTVSTSAVTGNSVQFNGTNQYFSVNRILDNSTDVTIEFWAYVTSTPAGAFVVAQYVQPPTGTNRTVFAIGSDLKISMQVGSTSVSSTGAITLNTWNHLAFVRSGSGANNFSIYINGVRDGQMTYTGTFQDTPTTIGGSNNYDPSGNSYFPGYISNLRILKGTALYTGASFSVPTSPLTAITNTSLLTCQSATIIDNSTNNFTITNNNTATVSSAVVPFTTSRSVFKLKKNNATPTGPTNYSVLFNGSTQYLSVANNAAFNLSTNNFTAEAWVYLTNSNAQQTIIGQWSGNVGGTTLSWIILTSNDANRYARFLISNNGSGVIGDYISTNAIPLNTWSHLALVRNGSAFNLYLNGISVTSTSTSVSVYYATNAITIGATSSPGQFLGGYISNARIINGTALYTASFTVPTTPLTAITNTQLLTCNAATIIDASSNNFTITNNNTATVSSTITPFTASISTNKFKLRQVSYSSAVIATQKAIFGYGDNSSGLTAITNLVSNTGVVATDTTGVGTGRRGLAAAGYGSDKAIFGYGCDNSTHYSITNLVSNTGVVSTNTTGVGTARNIPAAAGYGSDKAIFGYGTVGFTTFYSITNLVSNTGVVANDTAGVGTSRFGPAAASYGTDKAIFGYGYNGVGLSMTNLVSNTGVVSNDTAGVGTARWVLAAAGYGTDKAIFGYGNNGSNISMTNLVSNTGLVATDTAGVGTARDSLAAAGYGSDKAIFGYGINTSSTYYSITNLVSNTGVVSTDTTGVGTARFGLAAAGYSLS